MSNVNTHITDLPRALEPSGAVPAALFRRDGGEGWNWLVALLTSGAILTVLEIAGAGWMILVLLASAFFLILRARAEGFTQRAHRAARVSAAPQDRHDFLRARLEPAARRAVAAATTQSQPCLVESPRGLNKAAFRRRATKIPRDSEISKSNRAAARV